MAYKKLLYTNESLGKIITTRSSVVLGLLAFSVIVLYIRKDGIADHYDNLVSFTDIIYFVVTTITTVGYGDIVPVSTFTRVFDSVFLTLIRLLSWIIIFGTAYEFIIQREMEGWKMKGLRKRMKNHVIVCGFDELGKNIVRELIGSGVEKEKIIVIDTTDASLQVAADMGVTGFRGDATMESVLNLAGIEHAKTVIAAAGRDDTNILVCLTAKHLNKDVEVIGRVMESENIPLMKQSGADLVVPPLTIGSRVIAAAVREKTKYEHIRKELRF